MTQPLNKGDTMKQRKDYMEKRITHREYYGQFVNSTIKARVLSAFTLAELLASTRESFNDLPLSRWDMLAGGMATTLCSRQLKEAGDGHSLGSAVCILKEAAQQIVDEAREANKSVNLAAPNQQKRGFILRPSTDQGYQPKTGAACSCRPGVQRDNCAACEGTGMIIDFAAIRARKGIS